MRAGAGAGSKFGICARLHRYCQSLYRSSLGNRGPHIHEALRLSPHDISAFWWMLFLGSAKSFLGADAEAVTWLRRSIDAQRNLPFTHFNLAAALAHLGRLDEGRPLPALDLRSILASRSADFASTHRATIRPTLPGASASMRGCAWPGCLRGDVGDGSFVSVWPDHGDFRSTPANGHSQDRRACLKKCQFQTLALR